MEFTDEYWMKEAIKEAILAREKAEVPIGAVVVYDNEIIASGHNVRETEQLALGHAEIQVIQEANNKLGVWRLEGASLYVTLEPCAMCAGACIQARFDKVVYGAKDPKSGCAGSLMNLLTDERFNHQPEVVSGILEEECGDLLRAFFKELRLRNKKKKQL